MSEEVVTTADRIIQASLQLFATKGFEATSIRDIAMAAEVTSATLYYYIKNKEDFLLSIMERGLKPLLHNAKDILSHYETPEQRIAALVQMHVMAHGVNRLSALVIDTEFRALHGENKDAIRILRKEYEQIWQTVIKEGKEEGTFLFSEDSKLTTFALLEMCTGVVHWYSPKGNLSLIEISNNFANIALRLLGAVQNGNPLTVQTLDLPSPTQYYEPGFEEYAKYREVLMK
jgi:AcrR family transcriptional regulator